jgi:hypothetical protein
VSEVKEPGKKRFYFQGKVTLSVRQVIKALDIPELVTAKNAERISNVATDAQSQDQSKMTEQSSAEITVDFREPSPLIAEADRAKKFYDQGLMNAQIAARMGCARNTVTKLLKYWHTSRGLTMPDGRGRRSTLPKKQIGITLNESLAEEAKRLWDHGLADIQIAAQLGCSAPTAVAAVAHWFQSRGQSMPSHDERRLELTDRMVSLYDQNIPFREIAGQVGMCSRSVTLLLRERLQQLGRTMVDGRSRRGKDTSPIGRSQQFGDSETPSSVPEQEPNDNQSLPTSEP